MSCQMRIGLFRQVATLGLIATAWANGAGATPTCEGTYAATLLHPLPSSIVVDLDIHDRSARNLRLADKFLAGVHAAGVAVGAKPTVLLHVNTSRLNEDSGDASRRVELSYPELSGLQGGGQARLPPLPTRGMGTPRSSPSPPLLFLRIDATEGTNPRILWVASVQCRMLASDEEQVAEDLGRVIGGALGQRIERKPF